MANVRLLRQLAQRYDDRVNAVNAQYQGDRAIYEKAVDAHNASIDDAKSGVTYIGEPSGAPGSYALFGGTDSGGGVAYQGPATVVDATPQGAVEGSYDGEGGWVGPSPVYARNPDGTATRYAVHEVMTPQGDDGGYRRDHVWASEGTYKFLPSGEGPVAPKVDDPGRLGFTEKEKGLLQRPTLGPSEMNIAGAVGAGGTSTLAGDQPATVNSAFANPDDPNNLKDRGVLARVLGGQL